MIPSKSFVSDTVQQWERRNSDQSRSRDRDVQELSHSSLTRRMSPPDKESSDSTANGLWDSSRASYITIPPGLSSPRSDITIGQNDSPYSLRINTHDTDDDNDYNPHMFSTEKDGQIHVYGKRDGEVRKPLYSGIKDNIYVQGESQLNPTNIRSRSCLPLNMFGQGRRGILRRNSVWRQFLLLILVTVAIWVPSLVAMLFTGSLQIHDLNSPTLLQVGLFWWSLWLSVSWIGLWICWLLASVAPSVVRLFLGEVVSKERKNSLTYCLGALAEPMQLQLTYLKLTKRYFSTFLWCLLVRNKFDSSQKF